MGSDELRQEDEAIPLSTRGQMSSDHKFPRRVKTATQISIFIGRELFSS